MPEAERALSSYFLSWSKKRMPPVQLIILNLSLNSALAAFLVAERVIRLKKLWKRKG